MFIRQGRDKVFVIPAVVYLLVLFLSINIFIGQAVSGKDATLDNLAVISGDSRKPVHQEELPHYRAMDNPRRQRMEGDPHRQDEDARFSLHGRNTEAGRHGPKDTRYPTPEAMSVGESTEATNAATFTWEFETPDAPKYFDLLSSRAITVDASNHPHIAYGGDHLYYAYHDGTTWRYETVDASSIVGDWASLALDTSGHAHISYEDFANRDIRYATNASGSWVTTTVDSTGWVGWTNSIALDVSGHAHISYNDETNEDLKYATNVSGLWVTTTVDSGSVLYFGNSIAIDTTGHAHISYQDGNGLRYATNVSGLWVTTTVDNNGWVGVSTSLALDASGHVHISYRDNTNFVLKYATNASGSWITTTADSDGDVGQYTSLALDAFGKAHISHRDYAEKNLKYATNASGSWVTTTVDSSGDVGRYTSLALDTKGKAHISYLDWTNESLKYATNASGSWVTTTVDNRGNVGYDTSLALDSKGKAHISYNDETNGDLRYATNKSGQWVTAAVETNGNVGWNTSLALDTSDKAHISHFDNTNFDLKYTTNASGSWITTTVDHDGARDNYESFTCPIALDALGKVHISYPDRANMDLKYATSVHIPKAVTKPATNITKTSAKLNATVNANRLQAQAWFEWGTVSGGPYQNASPKRTLGGEKDRKDRYKVQGLTKATTYYYRVVAENEDGISYGDEVSFKTRL